MTHTAQIDLRALPNAPYVQQWLTDATEARGGAACKPLDYFINLAAEKARQYEELGNAYVDFQPGNSTAYMTVLHDLERPQIDATIRSRRAAAGWSDDASPSDRLEAAEVLRGQPYPSADLTVAQCRDYVRRAALGPAARLGGELLVALPENRGGVSAVFSVEHAMHVPYYVDQRLRLGPNDSPYVAAFLTLFCDAVTLLRSTP